MAKRLRILHLSDLHIGKEGDADAWRVERVMGEAWDDNLAEIRRSGQIDLVCFTGDLAQSGKPAQYADALKLVDALLHSLECPRDRFFCVPGNHDVDRSIASDAWTKVRDLQWSDPLGLSGWMAGGKPPFGCEPQWRECVVCRQQAYRDFLDAAQLSHLKPGQFDNPHPRLGYRRTLDLGRGAPLHIIGFDSAWLAGDNADAGKLRLTDHQIGRLMTGKDGKRLPGWRIGLIHHPLTDLADVRDAQRRFGEYGLDLLLHGHQHDPVVEHRSDPHAGLHVFAAGCLYEHDRYPNGMLVVDIELPESQPLRPRQVWARKWSDRLREWINDDELYRGTRNGRLNLIADDPTPYTSNPGAFVGRTRELGALCAAMLPAAQGAQATATIICCAIDGMPGVGKTRLAEEFISKHWLKQYPLPPDTPVGACVLRLVLAAGEAPLQLRSADDLVRDLADRLELRGDLDALRRALPAALRAGPGGHPRLLLIENVDSDAQAEQVATLVQGLPGCPVLVTARVRKFGGQHWKRVDVAPMTPEDAIDLLRNEAAAAGEDACVPTEEQAQRLAEALGYLPLALHIAASHLGMGKTPREFLDELRETGLALAPAQAGDHALQVDRVRAILRSSFALSWRAWCAGAGRDAAWQQALVALAHGPAGGVGESLGAAIADLPPAQYGRCIVAAGRLSLLEWEWAGDGEARERRVRLHALIAEFLRAMPPPDAQTVLARIGGWFAPRVSDDDPETMGAARGQVQREPDGLLHWLAGTQLDEAGLSIVKATHYAGANGPYGAWLACLQSAQPAAGETQRGLDLVWAITSLAEGSGDVPLAMQAAEAYAVLAKRLGNDYEYAVAQGKIADILQARGELEEALRIRRVEALPVYERLGDVRSRAITQGKIADILQARGELEEALRIRRVEALPVYERLGDVRERAITQGRIADILQARGELEGALRIRREEQMPVYERLGDVHSRAVTQGKIADILEARGELEEALRIRCEETLPVYERLGDVRSRAVTQGKIADILQARGELEEALRIRREEELPVYERLGDVRARAITQGKIADILEAYGDRDEAIRIYREDVLPAYERLGDIRMLLVDRANLAIKLVQRGREEDRPEILNLLRQALTDAERLRLPEAQTIRDLIARIFGPDDEAAPP